jgi:glycosyltransferase involved in cell wall biosynthesis
MSETIEKNYNAEGRPLISVMIPSYNCAEFLPIALKSVLDQDMGQELMQIEVVDDCSSQNLEEVVKTIGKGRVKYFRQPVNLGHVGNFNTCLKRASGTFIHQLHGDDYVLPDFYTAVIQQFKNNENLGAVFCQNFLVNNNNQVLNVSTLLQKQEGVIPDFLLQLAKVQKIFTPSIVVKREVYEKIGGFDSDLKWCEDWEMWTRIAANYEMGYVPKVLAAYRVHENSNTARYTKTAEKIDDLRTGIEIINKYLPAHLRNSYRRWSLNYYAEAWALNDVNVALENNDPALARTYLRKVFSMASRPTVYLRAMKLYLKSFL